MLQSCASSLRSLAISHIHLLDNDSWVDIISELPRVLKLDRIRLGRNLSEGSDPNATPFSFNEADSPEDARSKEISQAIKSLILKTDDAMLETTCSEIRRLLPELHAALLIEYEELENWHEEFGLSGEEEWISTSEEDEEEESDDSDDDNSTNSSEYY